MSDEAMIEAVARELCHTMGKDMGAADPGPPTDEMWADAPDDARELFTMLARAVHALYLPVIEKARRDALEQAAGVAISHSNYGHIEGNTRAFRIANDIKVRSLPVGDE